MKCQIVNSNYLRRIGVIRRKTFDANNYRNHHKRYVLCAEVSHFISLLNVTLSDFMHKNVEFSCFSCMRFSRRDNRWLADSCVDCAELRTGEVKGMIPRSLSGTLRYVSQSQALLRNTGKCFKFLFVIK